MDTISSKPSVKQPVQKQDTRPLVSIITPAYNEAEILQKNLDILYDYMTNLDDQYRWELVVINDASTDETGQLLNQFAEEHPKVKPFHHRVNRNLSGALQTGFAIAEGDYIIVLDVDLTYSEDHIQALLTTIIEKDADVVIASPYMKGGKNTAVPYKRLLMSKVVNRMMSIMSPERVYTFTGMVRAYKKEFLKSLNLKSRGFSINPEVIFKAQILRSRIVEIPAHLDWSDQKHISRTSSMKVMHNIMHSLMSAFIFRPYFFFMSIGVILFLISTYIIVWIFMNTFAAMPDIAPEIVGLERRFSAAVGMVFMERPSSFVIGGISLIIALQFVIVGFLSLQSKRYFDELFHLNTNMLRIFLDEKEAKNQDCIQILTLFRFLKS
jgi:glycosyltransferase involved in cell wall biosynthesis